VRKYYHGTWDTLSRLELNLDCWEDLILIVHANKRMPEATARAALDLIGVDLTEVEEERKAVGGGTVSLRARAHHRALAAAHTVVFQARRSAALDRVSALVLLLALDPTQMPLVLQQVCHYHRSCDGVACAGDEEPIYGILYECKLCDKDYCSACWGFHPKGHHLTMLQEVLPEDAAVAGDPWTVQSILGHKDTSGGREYNVSWVGPWADEFLLRSQLNADALVDAYVVFYV
jgi:hypothetical protein